MKCFICDSLKGNSSHNYKHENEEVVVAFLACEKCSNLIDLDIDNDELIAEKVSVFINKLKKELKTLFVPESKGY